MNSSPSALNVASGQKGGHIVKCKIALGALAVIGFVSLSATGAHAGAGGTPSLLTSFFVCNPVSGPDPGFQFDVESPVFGKFDTAGNPIPQRLQIGKAALSCAFARLFPAVPKGAPAPEPIEPGTGEQLTCYPLVNPNSQGNGTSPKYLVFDPLFNNSFTLSVPTQSGLLCAPGSYFQSQ
jgi:hypothetical protein